MYVFGYYLQDIVIKPIFKSGKECPGTQHGDYRHHRVWYVLDNLALMIFGPQYRSLPDNPLQGKMIELGEMFISVPKLWGAVTAVATAYAVYCFFRKHAQAVPSGHAALTAMRPVCPGSTSTRYTTWPSGSVRQ